MSQAARDSIVVTGAGLVTSLGASPESTWQQVASCAGGFGPMPALESPLPDGHTGAQAVDLPAGFEADLPREARYLRWTIRQALASAGWTTMPLGHHERCGVALGTTLHGMRAGGQFLRTGDAAKLRDFQAGNTLERAIQGLGFGAGAVTTCSACSSSLGSIVLAIALLESGRIDVAVAGGYDAASEYAYAGFHSLRLVTTGPLRPFARGRTGMKLGEGYGIVVLERLSNAERRGASPMAVILGWGESADAHHLTQPHPQGEGAAAAITAALDRAGLTPAGVDLIAAHATGTPDNDAGEAAALARVFGEHLPRIPVVGLKSHVGHTLGGAGAVELILSMMALRHQQVPGCAGTRADEIEFAGLNLALGPARVQPIRTTLNTSLGFGGANTCLILGSAAAAKAATRPAHASPRRNRDVLITGIGIVLPNAIGTEAFLRHLASAQPAAWLGDSGTLPEDQYVHLLNARRVRRMSDYVKLTLAATTLACSDAAVTPGGDRADAWAAILGSTHGSTAYCHAYYRQIVDEGMGAANPMLFAEGVPNAAAAHLSLMLGLKGACQTIIGSRAVGLDAMRLAAARIELGQWDHAIVGAAEEYLPVVGDAYRECGLRAAEGQGRPPFGAESGFTIGCGAVSFVLESGDAVRRRGGRALGAVTGSAAAGFEQGHAVAAASRVLAELGKCDVLFSSADATWVDRLELAALRQSGTAPRVTSMYGYWPELFSVGPLVSIAAGLLGGCTPPLPGATGERPDGAVGPGEGPCGSFAVLCSGFAKTVSGLRVTRTL
jgi:3-oxoacyl-[acyl-carrier-protein] synthase II